MEQKEKSKIGRWPIIWLAVQLAMFTAMMILGSIMVHQVENPPVVNNLKVKVENTFYGYYPYNTKLGILFKEANVFADANKEAVILNVDTIRIKDGVMIVKVYDKYDVWVFTMDSIVAWGVELD